MNLKLEYENKLDILDKYPRASKPSCYILGLFGETGEFLDKVSKNSTDETEMLVSELGDMIWYFTRFSTYIGISTDKILKDARKSGSPPATGMKSPTIRILIHLSFIAEKIKKSIRDKDGILDESDMVNIQLRMVAIARSIDYLAGILNTKWEKVAMKNLNKLNDRLKRKKIHGSGDKR